MSRAQLLAAGLSRHAIEHRTGRGLLRPVRRGVYAVGPVELDRRGRWMAALLACGPGALLSHSSAASLWGIAPPLPGIHVTVPPNARGAKGLLAHRREISPSEASRRENIPVTSLCLTLVDRAAITDDRQVEAALAEAHRVGLIDPDRLLADIDEMPRRRGMKRLRRVLRTFQPTDSDLERRFLRLVADANLPAPLTQQSVSGFRVDFYWPDLNLVVETDGLTYHRTPAQQARDHRRDQAHTAAGRTPLRFTNDQIRNEPQHVAATLKATIGRLTKS